LPPDARFRVVELEDPYGVPAGERASLVLPRGANAPSDVVRVWQAAAPPRIRVVQNLRGDVLAHMLARRQINKSSYAAGRRYQELVEMAQVAPVKGQDPTRDFGTGGNGTFGIDDAQLQASKELARANVRLARRIGALGLELVRDVLIRGQTIEAVAKARGDRSEREVRYWGGHFRRCLRVLAQVLGLST
jgi:hypothetical protein